jgi:hypothetical protein
MIGIWAVSTTRHDLLRRRFAVCDLQTVVAGDVSMSGI